MLTDRSPPRRMCALAMGLAGYAVALAVFLIGGLDWPDALKSAALFIPPAAIAGAVIMPRFLWGPPRRSYLAAAWGGALTAASASFTSAFAFAVFFTFFERGLRLEGLWAVIIVGAIATLITAPVGAVAGLTLRWSSRKSSAEMDQEIVDVF